MMMSPGFGDTGLGLSCSELLGDATAVLPPHESEQRMENGSDPMTATPNWETLEIRDFRGLERLELSRLGLFNVFLGANDVGKTTVLESVFLLSGLGNISLPMGVQNLRNYLVGDIDDLLPLLRNQDPRTMATLTASSHGGSNKSTLSISVTEEEGEDEANVKSAEKPTDKTSSLSVPATRRVLRYDITVVSTELEEPLRLSGTLVDKGDRFGPRMSSGSVDYIVPAQFIHREFGYDADVISQLIVYKNADELVKFLRVINPRVQAIATDGSIAYLDIGLDKMLPMNMFGSGMIRAASIVSSCIHKSQQILLIDEIDNGLHYGAVPSLLEALLKLSRERDIQVFATTHSLGLLTSLRDVLHRPELAGYRDTTAFYTLQRDKDGLVRSYRYGYADLDHSIENGIEIR